MNLALVEEQAAKSGWAFLSLFGSRARGTEGPSSDIDLAIWPAQGSRRTQELLSALGTGNVDIVWLDEASWLISQEVARDGQLLYQREPGLWEGFCSEAQLRFWDAEVWRRRTKNYLARVQEGDWTLNRDLIERKVALLAQYLRELKPILETDSVSFLREPMVHYSAERLVELLVESAGSINNEVSQSVAGIPPSDYYSSFYSLVSAGWLEPACAEGLGECARLRNTLVHRYESVDLAKLRLQLLKSIPYWEDYLQAILKQLNPV